MSIATKRGDSGQTSLVGGTRVSKADLCVEAYGTIDELNSSLGFARSICCNKEIAGWTEEIQRTLFRVGSALATPADSKKPASVVSTDDIDMLTNLVHRLEATEGVLSDWSLPGADTESAAYEVARTVCRRAERAVIRFIEAGAVVQPTILPYLNRLSDLIWLCGRIIEINAGIESSLRPDKKRGPKWSRAW
jgi:cob(I)alamin adenosyltransferase